MKDDDGREYRPWVAEAIREAREEIEQHRTVFRQNWEFDVSGRNIARVPCEGCGHPVVESKVYMHSLCSGCEVSRPQDFVNYLKAQQLMAAGLETVRYDAKVNAARVAHARQLILDGMHRNREAPKLLGEVLAALNAYPEV